MEGEIASAGPQLTVSTTATGAAEGAISPIIIARCLVPAFSYRKVQVFICASHCTRCTLYALLLPREMYCS